MTRPTAEQMLDWLADELHGEKWADALPWLRPSSLVDDEYTEKYIDRATFREAIFKGMNRELRQ